MTWKDRVAEETTVLNGRLQAPTVAEPGKGINTSPTGDASIDRGGGGPTGGYLDRAVRVKLEQAFQRRVDVVAANWRTAMLECRMEKLLEHEDTDVPWMETMLVALVSALVAAQFSKILELLRARAQLAAEEALEAGVTLPPSMTSSIFGATHPLSFEGLVKGSADNTRAKAFTKMAAKQALG